MFLVGGLIVAQPSPAPTIGATATESAPTQDGTFTVNWSSADPSMTEFEMQLDRSGTGADYRVWYRGPATQSFVFGQKNGSVAVRVRARRSGGGWSGWSKEARILVQHHSFTKALSLLTIGFFVFAAVAGYISYMAFKTRINS